MTSYFDLDKQQQRSIFEGARGRSPWSDRMLEKDLWVVWVLDALFRQPNASTYSFKGGTSLSKVYDAIHRFSEDVDVTIDPDHADLIPNLDPVEEGISKTQLKKRGDLARDKLPHYLGKVLAPYLEQVAGELPAHSRPTIEVSGKHKGQIRVHYPTNLAPAHEPPYITENVLLEFGGRASTEPSEVRNVTTYLAQTPGFSGSVELPTATVRVMMLERTFWEKVTLVHFENMLGDQATPKSRYARHWYDLHQLSSDSDRVQRALNDRETLRQVIHIKNTHYSGRGITYNGCGAGQLRLAPGVSLRELLSSDYEKMQQSAMFVKEPPRFDEIIEALGHLERQINERFTDDPIAL